MQLTKKILEQIQALADENGGRVYRRYSGRGMYGATCIGISCPDLTGVLVEVGRKKPSYDNLGRGYIVYWTTIEDDGEIQICEECGDLLKRVMLDLDGTNLEEGWECQNPDCWAF